MKVKYPEEGRVVVSVSGRDEGKIYIVAEARGDRLLLVDGRVRKLSNPKLKNVKHVRALPEAVSFEKDGSYDCKVAHYLKECKNN